METRLNAIQLHLLKMFGRDIPDDELEDIKKLLVGYYRNRIDKAVDDYWEQEEMTPKKWDERTRNLHLRRKEG